MSDKISNDRPAFPKSGSFNAEGPADFDSENQDGMTLRDYFAAKALAAIVGHENKAYENCGKPGVKKIANWAYEFADAMLEARDAK